MKNEENVENNGEAGRDPETSGYCQKFRIIITQFTVLRKRLTLEMMAM